MNQLPQIHLCIQQPDGYVHSLGLVDPARYYRYQFRRLGARVTVAKNRLRHDAVNFVFGAHLGFEAGLCERHACIFVNLEQLGQGGAQVGADYLKLLSASAVVDYNADNRAAYAVRPAEVPVAPLLYAPYLKPAQGIPLEERPIDLLFFGSMNERRRAWLNRIEALGHTVATFDAPLYGAERDQFIRQAKSVVNSHFYETSRFEQARVAHCLSLGTPVIAERTPQTQPHPAFENCVLWLQGDELEQFFSQDFGTPAYFDLARSALSAFERSDPIEAYGELLAFATGYLRTHHDRHPAQVWRPQVINVGSAHGYRAGCLNVDTVEAAQPDLLLDFTQPLDLPLEQVLATLGPIALTEGRVSAICVHAEPMSGGQLRQLLTNSLRLLQVGGLFQMDMRSTWTIAGTLGPTARWHLDERTWTELANRFWELGRWADRFVVHQFSYLGIDLQVCPAEQAVVTRVVLRKADTSLRESNTAQALLAALWLPDDAVDAQPQDHPRPAEPVRVASCVPVPVHAPAAAQVATRAQPVGRTCWERQTAMAD